MNTIKIHEQITFLRKQKGMTQEELAQALGVTNQAVSKWESAQCCPDIQLLPALARLFEVSIDALLGVAPAATNEDILLMLRQKIDTLPQGEDFDFTFRMAAALHALILSKEMTVVPNANPGWDTEDAVEHAGNAEWGYSCCNIPEITTLMRHGTVLFSNNRNSVLAPADIRRIVSTIQPFADVTHLKIASALYQLTLHAEDAFAPLPAISDACGIPEDKVFTCLTGALAPFLIKQESAKNEFRFAGMYMNIIPVLSIFDIGM